MAGKKAGSIRKDGKPAEKPGAPAHVPTAETKHRVEYLAGMGLPHEHIAVMVGLSDDKTLREHYPHELKSGKAKANSKVAQTLFHQATEGKNVAAAIFWTKSQMGWRETQTVEHTGPGGGPIQVAAFVGSVDRFLGALFGGGRRDPVLIEAAAADPLAESIKELPHVVTSVET